MAVRVVGRLGVDLRPSFPSGPSVEPGRLLGVGPPESRLGTVLGVAAATTGDLRGPARGLSVALIDFLLAGRGLREVAQDTSAVATECVRSGRESGTAR